MPDNAHHRVQSVERAFRLLEVMAEGGGSSSISELSAVTGMPAPTIYRLLRTMVDLDYLRRLPYRRYGLGEQLLRLRNDVGEPSVLSRRKKVHTVDLSATNADPFQRQREEGGDVEEWHEVSIPHRPRHSEGIRSIGDLVVGLRIEAVLSGHVRHWGPVQELFPAQDLVWIFDFQSGGRRLLALADFDEIRPLTA